jgi:Mrp family chromosome partitioning ATPase
MIALRMTLETSLAGRAPRVVMLTSPQGGEGTSTVAMQLASSLAEEAPDRILLVDLHARRPAHDADDGTRFAAEDAAHEAMPGAPRVHVLSVPESAREAAVIAPGAAREWLDAVADRYDWVVLDGPPLLESPDAAALATLADGVLLVIGAGRTKRPVIQRAVELLRKAGAKPLGSVLNRRRLEIPEFIYRRI